MFKIPALHVVTTKLIFIAAALHSKALLRHRRTLQERWKRSVDHLTAISDARVQASKRVTTASLAASEFDDVIHAGIDIFVDIAKK